ncbi:putative DNA processing protein DprA [Sulfobacillus acidophilus TPY]|uniref:SMF family protein n=1 Tax=Sulfobacillus acidophilus (strain ATCC 700253 / DSM 10332 / NAL) TaxID=679936 RepID=G8TU26_SULAD|nr:putative DNA processing protein DprA [Sulfobacillus acidophilus TPY]AEW04617.1 SMF family protein [Sulfobacillus acidophilus DSM 10332]
MVWTGSVDGLRDRPWIAVIGPRSASPALQRIAFRLAARLVQQGKVVVSGLADGIDAAAHRGALSVPEGRTVAVVSTAPDEPIYPPGHVDLARQIVMQGGAIGHPFVQPATSWAHRKWRLIERDLVVAERVTGIYVVTEDDPIDDGSRWAVARAYELERPVVRIDASGRLWPHPAIVSAVWTAPRESCDREN